MSSESFRIGPARSPREFEAVAELFSAYAESLPVDLEYQEFGSELAGLPGKYAPPKGELLIASDEHDRYIGCVGLRPLGRGKCEMKRLYVMPDMRSYGLGEALTAAIIEAARARGYFELFLDTLATMDAAVRLYERMGFERVRPYYGPTPPGTIFMKLDLKGGRKPSS